MPVDKPRLNVPAGYTVEGPAGRYADHCVNIANIIAAVCSRPDSPGDDVKAATEAVLLYLETVGEGER